MFEAFIIITILVKEFGHLPPILEIKINLFIYLSIADRSLTQSTK